MKKGRKNKSFDEEEAFRMALEKLKVPEILSTEMPILRKIFHLGVGYGVIHNGYKVKRAEERLGEFVRRNKLYDKILAIELNDYGGEAS